MKLCRHRHIIEQISSTSELEICNSCNSIVTTAYYDDVFIMPVYFDDHRGYIEYSKNVTRVHWWLLSEVITRIFTTMEVMGVHQYLLLKPPTKTFPLPSPIIMPLRAIPHKKSFIEHCSFMGDNLLA